MNRVLKIAFLSILLLSARHAVTAGAEETAQKYATNMASLTDYHGSVSYAVLLPQAEDPITYDIELTSSTVATDTLAPCRYLIEWTSGLQERDQGFAAYFDGSHYRFRDGRLQEYHMSWDSIPFIMGNGGVQCNAQFANVLPQFLGKELTRLLADTNFVYQFSPRKVVNGKEVALLEGKLMYHDYLTKEVTYTFDTATSMPITIEMENNPGALSEQTVTIKFVSHDNRAFPIESEADLIELYPDAFEKYRESNFRIENLPGTLLPTFTALTTDGQRYSYHRGEPMEAPTVIALIDDSANTPSTIAALRHAAAISPTPFNIIFTFVNVDAEHAATMVGRTNSSETLLTGGRTLARDCGVGVFPTLIYVETSGKVGNVTLGFNKDLDDVVIQKVNLLK